MIVTSTDIKNNFGKYIRLAVKEDIIITKNGKIIGKLSAYGEDAPGEYFAGEFENGFQAVRELAAEYYCKDSLLPSAENGPPTAQGTIKMSYEEFMKFNENSEQRYEYIDGEVYLLASPKTIHQRVLMEMSTAFYLWFQGKKCVPMISPYDITLKRNENSKSVVQPDLMVICDLEENLGASDMYMGTPALVVEIISKSTKSKDYVRKLDLYMFCGVKEYWIVNPESRQVNIFLFNEKDIFINKTFSFDDEITSFYFEGLSLNLKDF